MVLISLFELNTPEFTMLLGALPKTFQDGATKLLHTHLKNSSSTSGVVNASHVFIRLHSDLIMVTGHLVIFIDFTCYSASCHHVSYYSSHRLSWSNLMFAFPLVVPEYRFTVLFSFVLFIQSSPSNTIGRTPPRHPSSRTSPLTSPTNSSHTGLSPR